MSSELSAGFKNTCDSVEGDGSSVQLTFRSIRLDNLIGIFTNCHIPESPGAERLYNFSSTDQSSAACREMDL